MSYDYAFPETCTFGRHGVKAAGSVWASVQNEHSAPGIYVQPDTGFLMVFDHVNAKMVSGDDSAVTLEIENPTYRDGEISVLAETSEYARANALGWNAFHKWPKVHVPAGKTVTVTLPVEK